jgi:hypothetical protein
MISIFEMRDLLHQTDRHRQAPAGAPATPVATTEVSS